MSICRVVHNKNYTVINNTIAKDKNLSWRAKGIWLYAFSRPDDWTFYLKDLINQSTDGRDSVRKGLKELEKFGYLQRKRTRLPGGLFGHEWRFFEVPPSDFKIISPHTDFPSAVKPEAVNHPLLSTDAPSTDVPITKQQQAASPTAASRPTAAASSKRGNKQQEKPQTYECLEKIDIPIDDKVEITKTYDEARVVHAINFATHPDTEIKKGLAQTIKWACKVQPDLPKKKLSVYEELSLYFKNYGIYNGATCYLESEVIAFERGMNNLKLALDKFFTWRKFDTLCASFGITYERNKIRKKIP